MKKAITEERAERIARAHACEKCGEYTYKRVAVRKAPKDAPEDVVWIVEKICGVCATEHELGISADGRLIYVN